MEIVKVATQSPLTISTKWEKKHKLRNVRKKDKKVSFFIYQGVVENMLEKKSQMQTLKVSVRGRFCKNLSRELKVQEIYAFNPWDPTYRRWKCNSIIHLKHI